MFYDYPWVPKHFVTGKDIQVEAWRKGDISVLKKWPPMRDIVQRILTMA